MLIHATIATHAMFTNFPNIKLDFLSPQPHYLPDKIIILIEYEYGAQVDYSYNLQNCVYLIKYTFSLF